jgi:hypothetical protein
MKSGYPPSAPGTRVIATGLESPAEGVPDPIAHLRSIAGRNGTRDAHDARPIEFFALLRCKHGGLFPSSQMNERPRKGPPIENDIRDARGLLAADSCAAHFPQAGFCLMRIALFLARQFAIAPVSLFRGYLHCFS